MTNKDLAVEMIVFGVFVVTFFTFLGKVAMSLTGLNLYWWIAISGGMLWGTYFFARLSNREEKK